MTIDRRTLVIGRLGDILSALTITLSNGVIPAGNYVHNRNELPGPDPSDPVGSPGLVPGIILCDGDEQNDRKGYGAAPGMQPTKMRDQCIVMKPEIYVVLDVRKPLNLNVGEDLNTARRVILSAIMRDAELWNIVGPNGNIVYEGAITDLSRSREMRGQIGMSLSFHYPLRYIELS